MHSVTLILGGARSGKSSYAQRLASAHARVLLIATATGGDAEIEGKIERHKQDRVADGLAHWTVVEEPLSLADVIAREGPEHDVILIDCLTFFAAHLLAADVTERAPARSAFLASVCLPPCPILLVSNEVGSGVVPEYESGRLFRDLLGEINQDVASAATDVVLMVAGLPLILKQPVPQPSSRSPATFTSSS